MAVSEPYKADWLKQITKQENQMNQGIACLLKLYEDDINKWKLNETISVYGILEIPIRDKN